MADYISDIRPGMLIGLIDADLVNGGTRHPNLALMKISGYCKSLGCTVELLESYDRTEDYELVFVSKVFTFTSTPEDLQTRRNVRCGGTGFFSDGGENLPYAIEHHMPDYTLYSDYVERKIAEGRSRSWFADYLDYSIGFATRGCFRRCSFCVNKKYRHAFRHSPIDEFLDEGRPYIYLWDDNFFAYPKWEEILDELEATGKPFQFRQGLDVRLMDNRKARRLGHARYAGDFIFAFDHIEDRELIERKLKIWRSYTVRGTRLYVLCGYDSRDEKDIENTFERIRILMRYGCLPYIMRYEGADTSYHDSKWERLYVNIARWCNQPQFFKKKSFRQFCEANQLYHKNKNTKCSALQSMDDFEAEFPEIASRYFDLRYEEQNMYIRLGRKFYGKPDDDVCEVQSDSWERFRRGDLSRGEVIQYYFDKDLDIVWAKAYGDSKYVEDARRLFECIRDVSFDEVLDCLAISEYREPITPDNIPQYSSLEDVARVTYPLRMLDELITFEDMGVYLNPDEHKALTAHRKYGENHGKTASLLDLAYVDTTGRTGFLGTYFSELFDGLDEAGKAKMLAKLSLRIPIIRHMIVDAEDQVVNLGDYMVTLSKSTKIRRRPNVTKLLDVILQEAGDQNPRITKAINNIGRSL